MECFFHNLGNSWNILRTQRFKWIYEWMLWIDTSLTNFVSDLLAYGSVCHDFHFFWITDSALLSLFLSSWKIEVGDAPNYFIVLECLCVELYCECMGHWLETGMQFWFFSLKGFIMIRLDHLRIVYIIGVYFMVLNLSVWNFTYTVGCSLPLFSGTVCWLHQLLEDRKHPEPILASTKNRTG